MTPGKILKTELEIWNSLSDQNKRLKWILILFRGLNLSSTSRCLTSHQILLFQSNGASLVVLGGLWWCACVCASVSVSACMQLHVCSFLLLLKLLLKLLRKLSKRSKMSNVAVVHFALNWFANCIYSINCLPSSCRISFPLTVGK